MLPTDTYFPYQWHLLNLGQLGGRPGVDLNVVPVWADYTGAGVTVGIYDGGTQVEHPDLLPNWDPALQPMLNGQPVDPSPYGWNEHGPDPHGTAVAGLIVAPRNDYGVVGVAYNATFGAAIYEDASVAWAQGSASSYAVFQETINYQRALYDVTNNSYGPTEPLELDPAFRETGIENSVLLGRGGLGTINVIAAGNERAGSEHGESRWSTDAGFEALRQTVSVAAGTDQGDIAWYSNPGATLLVTAPVTYNQPDLDTNEIAKPLQSTTTDLVGPDGYSAVSSPEIDVDYTDRMAGTSAAAPMVTGVVALMLEANSALGYRDVQEILALSARANWQQGAFEVDGWQINGADHFNGGGLAFSHDYGFGFVDALAAVRLAETWGEQRTGYNEVSISSPMVLQIEDEEIPDYTGEVLAYTFEVTEAYEVEWIEVGVAIEHPWWGDLVVSVISPDGTLSRLLDRPGVVPEPLLEYRVREDDGFDPEQNLGIQGTEDLNRDFVSTASRGESSVGTWTVLVGDVGGGSDSAGDLDGLSLQLYGNPEGETLETFYYTNRYAELASADPQRQVLYTEGEARINAAAVSSDSIISLEPGITGQIAGTPFLVAAGSMITEVIAGDGNDALFAAVWESTLMGGRGNDYLEGNLADDILIGGPGDDLMVGGGGADTFVFASQSGRDRIADFDPIADRLEVEQEINGQRLSSAEALLEAAFHDTAGNAVLDFGADNRVTLVGVSLDQLIPEHISLV